MMMMTMMMSCFYMCPERTFAIRRSQAIPLLHMLDGFMYRQTHEGPVCRSILQPQVYHQLLLCEYIGGFSLHSLNGTLCFLWYHCSHSQLLTIYLDVIVCNIIKEKNMNVSVGSDAV